MKKLSLFFTILFSIPSIISITTTSAFADTTVNTTINTEIYKFISKSGTPVFSDKVPPKRKFKKKSITVNQPENMNEDHDSSSDHEAYRQYKENKKLAERDIQKMLDKVYSQYTARDKSFQKYNPKEATENKPKKTSLKVCKKYKKKFDKVTDKMRIGYSVNEYRGLEAKRVKYRDLLFNECNSFDLI